jgi:hypothetical protein
MTWHKDATPPDVHIPYAYSYASQTARENATGLVAADVGKFARQTDDDTIWMLLDESPVTWKFIGGGVGADTFLGLADTPNTYSGDGGKLVAVKGTTDGLEFVDIDLSEIQDHIDSTAIHFFEYDIDHRNIQYIGTYTHDEIDSHINDTSSNPHAVTASQAGAAPTVHTHVEADITDLDHDALKIMGVPVDDSEIDDGKVLVYDSTTGELQYEYIAEATGLTISAEWKFSTNTADSDPGNGNFRLNNATQASSTFIYVDDASNQGADMSLLLSSLRSGDMIYIQQRDDSSRALLFEISGTPTDGTGYWKIPVQNGEATINDLVNNKVCAFLFHATGLHSVAWGSITGTLSNQTDLQTELNGKSDTGHTHTESDITDLDHDALKIQGVDVDDTDIADGRVLKYNSVSGNLEYEDETGGGGLTEIEVWEDTDEAESSTTSETYQEKLQLSAVIDTTGTFMLEWYAEARQQTVGDAVECRVQEEDTTTHAECRYYTGDSGGTNWVGDFQPFAGHIRLDRDAGTYEFDIDYRSTDSGNTAEIRRARLTLWRMS